MQERDNEIKPFPLWIVIACGILTIFFMKLAIDADSQSKAENSRYPAEILQPVHLITLPHLIDNDTESIVFIKRGCLKATRDELEAIRDKNSSDKEMYLIGGHPVKIEVKFCGE